MDRLAVEFWAAEEAFVEGPSAVEPFDEEEAINNQSQESRWLSERSRIYSTASSWFCIWIKVGYSVHGTNWSKQDPQRFYGNPKCCLVKVKSQRRANQEDYNRLQLLLIFLPKKASPMAIIFIPKLWRRWFNLKKNINSFIFITNYKYQINKIETREFVNV